MTKAEKHLLEAEKSVKKARRHLARILIDECEGSELLRETHPGLRISARWLEEVLDGLSRGKRLAAGNPMPIEDFCGREVNLAPTVGEDGVARWAGTSPMQQLAYQLEAEKKGVVLENWQLKQENQLLRDENSELKLPKPPACRDDEMEPAESLEERLDHIERRLADLEEWRCSTY